MKPNKENHLNQKIPTPFEPAEPLRNGGPQLTKLLPRIEAECEEAMRGITQAARRAADISPMIRDIADKIGLLADISCSGAPAGLVNDARVELTSTETAALDLVSRLQGMQSSTDQIEAAILKLGTDLVVINSLSAAIAVSLQEHNRANAEHALGVRQRPEA